MFETPTQSVRAFVATFQSGPFERPISSLRSMSGEPPPSTLGGGKLRLKLVG